jgi:hypothetical protein
MHFVDLVHLFESEDNAPMDWHCAARAPRSTCAWGHEHFVTRACTQHRGHVMRITRAYHRVRNTRFGFAFVTRVRRANVDVRDDLITPKFAIYVEQCLLKPCKVRHFSPKL